MAGSHKPYGGRSHRGRPRCAFSLYSLRPFPPFHSVRISHCLARSRQMCLIPPPPLRFCLALSFHLQSVYISHGTLLASALLSRLLLVSLPLSLCLSIVHNYTIRLLNRLMRPPLPAVAAPFTETTGRARPPSSLCLRRSVSFAFSKSGDCHLSIRPRFFSLVFIFCEF